ncbi:hypothetical protein [uncultured Enterococcus sp.]|uniref:hypothetical protein n=1 Tax=uncultured Enterococcus sp. TaxID=167972 RepID=UPI002AA839F8|nr:hypothetical protein [uncultured Enterococcus sp.]
MKNRKLLLTLLFTALSICYILPMLDINTMRFGVTRGDDYPFHVARILSLIQQLKGTGWSQFVASFGSHEIFYGANIFYPPLTSAYPIALLAILFRSFISGYYVYIVLLNVVTCWIAYFCSYYAIQRSTIEKNKVKLAETGALLFAVFYTFSHYRLLCIFERMALGEYTALTFYPLVFAGFLQCAF